MHPQKGLLELVRAWGQVAPVGWRLRIAGPDEGGHWGAVARLVGHLGLEAVVDYVGPVEVERRAAMRGAAGSMSHRTHLCAGSHDYRDPTLPLLRPPIEIGAQAWVCADAFIGPEVRVGEGAVVGAAAVVVRDVAPWRIVVGNPARPVKMRRMRPFNE